MEIIACQFLGCVTDIGSPRGEMMKLSAPLVFISTMGMQESCSHYLLQDSGTIKNSLFFFSFFSLISLQFCSSQMKKYTFHHGMELKVIKHTWPAWHSVGS